jgi:hypothetical protein
VRAGAVVVVVCAWVDYSWTGNGWSGAERSGAGRNTALNDRLACR